MNNKITLPTLINLLALRTGGNKRQAEDFLKEFFASIASALADGDQVKVRDLGVFKTIAVDARKSVNVSTGEEHEIPAHRKVVFVPSKELAALVNEPFEMFETVEIPGEPPLDTNPDLDDAALAQTDDDDLNVYTYPLEGNEMESSTSDVVLNNDSEIPDKDSKVENSPTEHSPAENLPSSESISLADNPTHVQSSVNSEYGEESGEHPDSQDTDEVTVSPIDSMPDDSEPDDSEAADSTPFFDEGEDETESANEHAYPKYPDEETIEEEEELHAKPHTRFWVGFLCGLASMALIGVVLQICIVMFGWHSPDLSKVIKAKNAEVATLTQQPADSMTSVLPSEQAVASPETEEEVADTVQDVTVASEQPLPKATAEAAEDAAPTRPSDEPVYDTITKTRYLTTMAKDHYGNYNLWPYIYEENKEFLGHPDRIKPGTRVVIPDLKKYGINPSNPDDIAKAKKKGVEIYSRYK